MALSKAHQGFKECKIQENFISLKSKIHSVVARSDVEAEDRTVTLITCELIWLKQLLNELQFEETTQMALIYLNQARLHIASNQIFHEKSNCIEIDCPLS